MRKKVRDIYGNWVWEEVEVNPNPESNDKKSNTSVTESQKDKDQYRENQEASLEWRDYVALIVASLETFLLPMVIFILIVVGIVLALAFF